jgi:hydroxymethylglutaryl-CoA lyase
MYTMFGEPSKPDALMAFSDASASLLGSQPSQRSGERVQPDVPGDVHDPEGAPMRQVEIVEVGPRDGLQNEPTLLSTADKIELIARSVAAGARRIEVTAFVHPTRVPQMADAEAVMRDLERHDGVSYAGLVLNERGLDRALAAGVDEVNVVVVASDTFSMRNQGVPTEQGLDVAARVVAAVSGTEVRSTVTIAAAFGCPFEGEVDPAQVVELARRILAQGPDEIALADTIGVAVPAQMTGLVRRVVDLAQGVPVRAHLHNTRSTGYANAIAAIDAGVGALDASLGGIGGCPFAPSATGNIATEDLAWMLGRSGITTGLDLDGLIHASDWLATRLGRDLDAQIGRAGVFPSTPSPGGDEGPRPR